MIILASACLLVIGVVPIADSFGRHILKGYTYVAMAFAACVEALYMLSRRGS